LSSTPTVSCSSRVDVPFTLTGLRHCVFESGSLTTIGDFTGPVVVVAECFEDEQAVAQRRSSAARGQARAEA
jgi:hypothetical protein